MGLLERARERLHAICNERRQDPGLPVAVRPLSPVEAIGWHADKEFAINKGKERVIEAVFCGVRGQAFTDQPSSWSGTLAELLEMELLQTDRRAAFVAGMNAILRKLSLAEGTIHCQDQDPTRCGPEIAEKIVGRFGRVRVGLIGLQPAILAGLVIKFGADNVRVTDLNPDNIGAVRQDVTVWDGDRDLTKLVAWCNVGLATGSAVVNGTADQIVNRFEDAGKPLIFFGNTISGVAALLALDRLCPFGR